MLEPHSEIAEENESTSSQEDIRECLPYVCDVTESMRQAAEQYLGETPEFREKCLKELRERVANEPNLDCRLDDGFLLNFLRSRKFDVDRAFGMIQRFSMFVTNYIHFLVVRFEPSAPQRFADSNVIGFLPYRDPEGRAIMYLRPGVWDPDKLPLEDAIYGFLVVMQSFLEMQANQIMGFVAIIDAQNLPVKKMLMLAPKYTFILSHGLQYCCPCKVAAIHGVNTSEVIRIALKLITPVMSPKLWKRVHIHKTNDFDTLHQFIPKKILPSEWGGDLGPFSNAHWAVNLEKLRIQFNEEIKRGYTKQKKEKGRSFKGSFSSKSSKSSKTTR